MELVLDRVTKQYKNKIAVDRVSYVMHPGVYGLLGANGAGKTTLMRMICGVLMPDSGEVKMNGLDAKEEGYRDGLGYLPQDFGYYPEFTAMDFLMYMAGLDPKERVKFRNMIAKLGKDRVVLLSTHIVSDVEYIANEILIMKEGRLIHHGTLEEVISAIRGRVYECKTDGETGQRLAEKYPIVNLREEADGVFLRLVSEKKPCETAVLAEETLEDLYLYYFSGREEKDDE